MAAFWAQFFFMVDFNFQFLVKRSGSVFHHQAQYLTTKFQISSSVLRHQKNPSKAEAPEYPERGTEKGVALPLQVTWQRSTWQVAFVFGWVPKGSHGFP